MTTKVSSAMLEDGSEVVGLVPVGAVLPFGGTTEPANWLFARGQAVSRTTYATLFAAIGTAFGAGDGSTTFNVPDLRGRVPVGRDNMGGTPANRVTAAVSGLAATTLGATGGDQRLHRLDMRARRDFRDPQIDLNDKQILVTGGTGGIGTAIVRYLARQGHRVASNYRDADRAEQWRQAMAAEGIEVCMVAGDVAERPGVGNELLRRTDRGERSDPRERAIVESQFVDHAPYLGFVSGIRCYPETGAR